MEIPPAVAAAAPAAGVIGNNAHWVLDADLNTLGENDTVVQVGKSWRTANQTN